MLALASGDRGALRVLYERHAGFVYRTAYRFLYDSEEAQDIAQSVFVTLLESSRRYKPSARFTTWLYRIVVNRCLNHKSKADRRLRAPREDHDRLEQVPAPEGDRPDRRLEHNRQLARLRDALLRLPRRQRLALVLQRYEGMRYEQIAEVLDCSKSSIESMLYRAREALKREWSE
jgi:RNA polymerase sigma-70 factor (ECF subfamily)